MSVVQNNKARVQPKRFGLKAEQVATYIKLGRQKVMGSAYDPYARYKNPMQAMARDAMLIAAWFNNMRSRWTEQERMSAYSMISEIQHGPQGWWRRVLVAELSPIELRAAESWAARHNAGVFVDVNLAPDTRARIAEVIRKRMKGWQYEKTAMLDLLRFVFHGLGANGSGDPLHL